MYLDSDLLFSGTVSAPGWSPTTGATNLSPNVHDTSPLGNQFTVGSITTGQLNTYRDLGGGRDMYLAILTTTAASSGVSVTFQWVTDSTSTITTQNVLLQTPAFLTANLTLGSSFFTALPRGSLMNSLYKRYVGVNANISGTFTGGTWEVWLTSSVQDMQARVGIYQPGFLVK